MNGLSIEDMRRRHLPDVMSIELNSFETPWSEASFLKELYNPNSILKVAIIGGAVAGYVCAYHAADEGHILNLAVRADMRRQGIAKALVKSILGELKSYGLRSVYLEVRASNHPARSLYEGFGFKVIGTRKAYYLMPVEDAVVMRVEI